MVRRPPDSAGSTSAPACSWSSTRSRKKANEPPSREGIAAMTNPGTTPPRLVVIEPADQAGVILSLSGAQLVIGHSDTADLVLNDRFVSRRHALVAVDQSGTVTITDLKSTSGTFVNDERLDDPRILREGDTVRFADLVARFEPGSGPVAGAAAAKDTDEDTDEEGVTYTVTGRVLSQALPSIAGLAVRL